jgi:hypothetical protein
MHRPHHTSHEWYERDAARAIADDRHYYGNVSDAETLNVLPPKPKEPGAATEPAPEPEPTPLIIRDDEL